jgi:hypothetical protein
MLELLTVLVFVHKLIIFILMVDVVLFLEVLLRLLLRGASFS